MKELNRTSEGRYSICLAWISEPEIPSDWHIAVKRFLGTMKRLKTMNQYADYETHSENG